MSILIVIVFFFLFVCGIDLLLQGGAMGSASACDCSGAVVNGVCYGTVAQAVGAASSGSTVTIGGTKEISSPVGISAESLTYVLLTFFY